MKKIIFLIVTTGLLLLSGCSKEPDMAMVENQVRKIAWDSMDADSRSTVTHSWKSAVVIKAVSPFENYMPPMMPNDGKVCYWVRFNTSDDGILGPITIAVDKNNLEVLGGIPRL